MTTDTDDPRPAATEANLQVPMIWHHLENEEPIDALIAIVGSGYEYAADLSHDVAPEAVAEWVARSIEASGYRLNAAAAPPDGQVCVSRETAVRIWQRLPERNLTITTGSDPDLMEFARAIALSEGAAK